MLKALHVKDAAAPSTQQRNSYRIHGLGAMSNNPPHPSLLHASSAQQQLPPQETHASPEITRQTANETQRDYSQGQAHHPQQHPSLQHPSSRPAQPHEIRQVQLPHPHPHTQQQGPVAADTVAHLVTTLMTAASEQGYNVEAVSLSTPLHAQPAWPSVVVNGATLALPPTQWPSVPNPWSIAVNPSYHLHHPHPYQTAVAQYYNPQAYLVATGHPRGVAHAPPNIFWSTVLHNQPPTLAENAANPAPHRIDAMEADREHEASIPGSSTQTIPSLANPTGMASSRGPATHSSHQSGSAQPKEYICPRCNASFKTNSNMQKHVRTVHDNCRPFKCDQCDVSYGHKNLLVEHVRTAHHGERPFVCETCGARFGRSSNLYSHMKSHDGKREHQCKTCNVSFSLHGNMVKHIKTVHLKQRPFLCEVCNSRFGLRSDLMRHKRNVHGIVDKDSKGASSGRSSGPRNGSTASKDESAGKETEAAEK